MLQCNSKYLSDPQEGYYQIILARTGGDNTQRLTMGIPASFEQFHRLAPHNQGNQYPKRTYLPG